VTNPQPPAPAAGKEEGEGKGEGEGGPGGKPLAWRATRTGKVIRSIHTGKGLMTSRNLWAFWVLYCSSKFTVMHDFGVHWITWSYDHNMHCDTCSLIIHTFTHAHPYTHTIRFFSSLFSTGGSIGSTLPDYWTHPLTLH
jgi:hypothetical protein